MMYSTDTLFEDGRRRTLIAAHRGVSSANIPCNSLAAFEVALRQHADIIELDVARSRDGGLFVFHPGMEKPHLGLDRYLSDMTRQEIAALRYVNQDDCPTPYPVNTLDDILELLKDRCLINVDKFWTCMEEITACIRAHGMEKQVIVKTPADPRCFDMLENVAPDFAYMPVIWSNDTFTPDLMRRSINYVGAEVIFGSDDEPVAQTGYIEDMHKKGLLVWANAIVYDSNAVISGGHTDDGALTGDPDAHWGWLIDRGFDIIQTDWCSMLQKYIAARHR